MIRVLMVEDSHLMARLLGSIIESQADFEIVGRAEDGQAAIDLAQSLRPDVITMDVNMPILDGMEATRAIMSTAPVPIIIVSSLVNGNQMMVTFRALEEGAVAVLEKPDNQDSVRFEAYSRKLTDTVRSMAGLKLVKRKTAPTAPTTRVAAAPLNVPMSGNRTSYEVVAIGASTGGPQIVNKILSSLPADFSVPLLVVNHIAAGFTAGMSKWLERNCKLEVVIPNHGDRLVPGRVYIAPEDRHLMLARRRGELVAAVNNSEPVNQFRPSVTPLMQSVATTSGEKSIGIILSGMGTDGAAGLLDVKKAGGQTFVQSEQSCVVFGMPGEAIRIGAANQTLEPDRIASRLMQLVSSGVRGRN